MKPFYKYLGGKRRELKFLRSHFPDKNSYQTYCEPFFGGGAVFWDIEPKVAVINDIDKDLMNFLRIVKGNGAVLNKFVCNFPNNKETFLLFRDDYEEAKKQYCTPDVKDDLFKAMRYFYFLRTSFNGYLRYNSKKGKYNMSYGLSGRPIRPIPEENISLLQTTAIFSKDFRELLEAYDNKSTFFFFDPPYDGLFSYLNDGDLEKENTKKTLQALNDFIRQTDAKCLLTIGSTPYTEELFKGLIVDRYVAKHTFGAHCRGKDLQNYTLVIRNYDL